MAHYDLSDKKYSKGTENENIFNLQLLVAKVEIPQEENDQKRQKKDVWKNSNVNNA
jgi:hypothetical protein